MQGDHGYYGGRDSPPQGYGYGYGSYGDSGGYGYGYGYPSAYEDPRGAGQRAHEFPGPLNGLEVQPSETCPRNYVIFDQTCTRSRVMFHPSLEQNLGGGSSGHDHHHYDGYYGGAYRDTNTADDDDEEDEDSCSARRKEDSEEIDALLSADQDDDDDDAVSTCSSSYGGGRPRPKKERVKTMMRRLKGVVPGGSQMDTPAVLDEAVRYLKSLKVEAKKLGVRGGGRSDS